MSCPWMENREAKESEKTMRLAPLRRFWAQDAEVTLGLRVYKGTDQRKARKEDTKKNREKCFVTLFEHCKII